jgi:hypothetical protein
MTLEKVRDALKARLMDQAADSLGADDIFWAAVDANLAQWFEDSRGETADLWITGHDGPVVAYALANSDAVLVAPLRLPEVIGDVQDVRRLPPSSEAAIAARAAALKYRTFADAVNLIAEKAEWLAGLRP